MSGGESESRGNFNHPFKPYDIQLELMQCIYDTLSDKTKKIAILESPTGTGKTLSLICSTITWLRENKSNFLVQDSSNDSDFSDDEDWVNETYKTSVLKDKLVLLNDYERHLSDLKLNTKINEVISIQEKKKRRKKVQVEIEDKELLPDPYESDSSSSSSKAKLNDEIKELLSKIDRKTAKSNDSNIFVNASLNPVKIYFASRTHSQLNQFASQLRLPTFPSSFDKNLVPSERIKYLPLGSKKQLCIEPSVKKWKTLEAINDACSELRHSKDGCPYYTNTTEWHQSLANNTFRDNIFAKVHDIEDLVSLGETLHICPYYASRDHLDGVEIVTLPYQYLLSEQTRRIMNLDLQNSIVIIDEAHNLIDTINSIHSNEVSLAELKICNKGLQLYLNNFKKRLNPGNRVNILKLIKLINVFIEFITKKFTKPGIKIDINDIMTGTNTDVLNIHKLSKYIQTSRIAYKIDTYLVRIKDKLDPTLIINSKSQPLLFKVSSFLSSLNNPSSEGQFFFEKGPAMKYMLLEPNKQFESIVNGSLKVILAGGTMEPVSDFYDNLFPQIPKNEAVKFSCDHIIPDSNLNTFIVDRESNFEFTFGKRTDAQLINADLYNFITKLSQNVPKNGGIIVFLPSYQYLKTVIDNWKQNGTFDKLNQIRKIFYESKDNEDPLSKYIECVQDGSVLFAVVGGKLSEGINFQDNLCRALVMVGLPFPNVFSGELTIKRAHIEEKTIRNGGTQKEAKEATKEFLENICMKAVNQCVGRAIRHANDYSNIYLLDKRYNNDNIRDKLSNWVKRRIQKDNSVDAIMNATRSFL
ncbi:hypothetical protein KAFR_0B01730 [Kazachstania africana CBS 2517]|uniref:ATP-dependent DNA helicase CHL1 n=1 Tax=Kazachstania africana (strain ATCC 22294 / BCRC 22015 / CBS 2517 / CECT 1963 / NBRC 1671 / NRRL Y-8276) TaxID=1071382 RepID=H2AQ22_KAZAF|nr:hypothetical protein KAFR_0B01730 [Kazachstania africana CBS 2517]CCF56472.1 hypothetical protein KAFR_0B01730 [Kazachstania africana CBS 2517]